MDFGKESLSLNYIRRFGVEIEINSFDMRDRPIGYDDGALPDGIHYVGNLVQKLTQEKVLIHKWGNDHNNDLWIIKPDGSCGMEVCTPVLKGWMGLMQVCRVIDGFSKNQKISADDRCSLHVHVDVSDLTEPQLASILTWWIKSEPVFLDSVPPKRKKNRYCQLLGQTDIFDEIEDGLLSFDTLVRKLGICKYYTINTFHYHYKKRKSIEFRIMDNECCLNPWMAKNWVRLVLHFVEKAIQKGLPPSYEPGNKWSSYCWLDPIDLFEFLGFMPGQCDLSPGLQQVRSWFVGRLDSQSRNTGLLGVMSDRGRRIAHNQIDQLMKEISPKIAFSNEDIYSENFRV
jgi:hypothetical protein